MDTNKLSDEMLEEVSGGLVLDGTRPEVKPQPQTQYLIYTVQKGDMLSVIAYNNRTTVQKLCEINGIKNPDKIEVGQKIRIPLVTK